MPEREQTAFDFAVASLTESIDKLRRTAESGAYLPPEQLEILAGKIEIGLTTLIKVGNSVVPRGQRRATGDDPR